MHSLELCEREGSSDTESPSFFLSFLRGRDEHRTSREDKPVINAMHTNSSFAHRLRVRRTRYLQVVCRWDRTYILPERVPKESRYSLGTAVSTGYFLRYLLLLLRQFSFIYIFLSHTCTFQRLDEPLTQVSSLPPPLLAFIFYRA